MLISYKQSVTLLAGEVREVKEELQDLKRVVTVYPAIEQWKADMKVLSAFGEEFSVKEYLSAKDIEMDGETVYRKVRLQVSQAYKTLTGEQPKQRAVFTTRTGKRKRTSFEYVYRSEDIPMLEEIVRKLELA